MGRFAWRRRRSRAPQRSWRAAHQPRVRHQGRGIRDASLDRHGWRLVRQRHGRIRRRRVQDRASVAAQAIRRPGRAGIGDVSVGLVVELEAAAPVLGLQDTGSGGNRVLCKPSGTSRLTIRAEQKSGHINSPVNVPVLSRVMTSNRNNRQKEQLAFCGNNDALKTRILTRDLGGRPPLGHHVQYNNAVGLRDG